MTITLRRATLADVAILEAWDEDPEVMASSGADDDIDWPVEIAAQSAVSFHLIAECDGRPIGAMQVIDPQLEPTHYWGEIGPGLRAIDIWIGVADDRNRGYGAEMMRQAIELCFAEPAVTAIIIDPLMSNADAHRFYQRLGFTVVGPRRFGDDDCLVHQLTRQDWRRLHPGG